MGRNRSRESIQKVILEYEVDENSVNQADAAATSILTSYNSLETRAKSAGQGADAYSDAVDAQAKAQQQAARSGRMVENSLSEQERAYENAQKAARDYGESARRAADDVEQFGDTATNISQISGALSGLGLEGVGGAGMIGADIADLVEGSRRLGPALGEVGNTIRGVGQSVADAVPLLTSSTQGLLALGVAGGLAAAGVALVTAAFADNARRAEEAAQAAYDAETARLTGQERAIAEFEQGGGTNETRLALLADSQAEERRIYAAQGAAFESMQNSAMDAIEQYELLVGEGFYSPLIDGAVDTQEEFDAVWQAMQRNINTASSMDVDNLKSTFDAANDQYDLLGSKIDENTAFQEGLSSMYVLQAVSANEAAEATKTLADNTDNLADKAERAAAATEEAAEATAKWTDEQTRQAEAARDAALEGLDRQRSLTEFNDGLRAILDTADEEAKLTEASETRIAGLNTAFDKFAGETEKRIAEINRSIQADTMKAQQDFMREGTAASAKFLEQERNQQEAHNLERLRMLEDLNDDLLSAEEANDVIRFIQTQRAGEKNLRRLDEDATAAQQERSKEFIAEQKQRRVEYQQRLSDIRSAGAQRIQAEREKLAERRQLLVQQIADERAALMQRIADTRTAAMQEVEMRRQQYIQELQDQAKYNAQREAIEAAHQSRLRKIAQDAQRVEAQARSVALSSTVNKARSTTPKSSFSKSSSSSTSINIGSIGSGMTYSGVVSAITGAITQVENAKRRGVVKASG